MKTDSEIFSMFTPLWRGVMNASTFPEKKPLLAHYTSMETLESIMANDCIWMSNPLFMNDVDELRFGIREGVSAFRLNKAIKEACITEARYRLLQKKFEDKLNEFTEEHLFDTYIFSLSEHDPHNGPDGLLSMWRGYGGNGKGAAIIFDTSKLNYLEKSPMIISSVVYASSDNRKKWIDEKLNEFAQIFKLGDIPDEKFYLAIHAIFERIKIFALFTKHHGFSEEKEWRVAYLPERDQEKKFTHMLHYAVGRNGIEPKLKYKIEPMEGVTDGALSLEKIVHQVILGPSTSGPLAINSVRRMLEKVNKPNIATKLTASTTPFRAV